MPATEFLEVDGRRLEYVRHGPPPQEAPTLVLLHEGLGCAAMWKDFPARLAEATGLGALVYSRLGYGASDPCEVPRPLSYMHDAASGELPGVLAAAGIRQSILVGHSDGGSIALVYASNNPSGALLGLILEAPHVFVEDISVASIADARQAYEDGNLKRQLEKYHGPNVDGAFWGWNDAWLDPEFRKWNLEKYLPGVEAPVLVIQGEDDQYGTRAQADAIVAQAGGGADLLMVPECGHSPHRDQGDTVLAAMTAFVEGLGSEGL